MKFENVSRPSGFCHEVAASNPNYNAHSHGSACAATSRSGAVTGICNIVVILAGVFAVKLVCLSAFHRRERYDVFTYVCVHVSKRECARVYVCVYVCMCVCMYARMHVCMYVCMLVC